MASPTLKLEVALTVGPVDPNPTWTEFDSDDILSFNLTKGRQAVTDDSSQPSTCTITLDNSRREYDPAYTSGTHYPNLDPARQVRLSAVHSTVEYVLFQGIVNPEGWQQTGYQHPDRSLAVISCVDIFGHLANRPFWYPLFETYLLKLGFENSLIGTGGDLVHYPLDDSGSEFELQQTFQREPVAGSALYNSSPGVAVGWIDDLANATNDVLVSAVHSDTQVRAVRSGSLDTKLGAAILSINGVAFQSTSTRSCTHGMGVKLRSFPAIDGAYLMSADSFGAGSGFILDHDGTLKASWDEGTTYVTSDRKLELGKSHQIVGTWDHSTTTAALYLDGVLVGSNTSYPTDTGTGLIQVYVGQYLATNGEYTTNGPYANVVDVFAMGMAADAPQVRNMWGLWSGAGGGLTGYAAGVALDAVGVPNRTFGGRVGTTEFADATPSVSSIIQALERTERGRIYFKHDVGRVEMVTQEDLVNGARHTVAQVVLSDVPADIGAGFLRYTSPVIVTLKPTTEARVTDAAGSSWIHRAHTEADTYGVFTKSVSTLGDVPADTIALAQTLVWADPQPRQVIQKVTVNPTSDTEFVEALTLELFDAATIRHTPHNLGNQTDNLTLIEGLTMTAGSGTEDWRMDLFLRNVSGDTSPFNYDAGEFDTNGVDPNGAELQA